MQTACGRDQKFLRRAGWTGRVKVEGAQWGKANVECGKGVTHNFPFAQVGWKELSEILLEYYWYMWGFFALLVALGSGGQALVFNEASAWGLK